MTQQPNIDLVLARCLSMLRGSGLQVADLEAFSRTGAADDRRGQVAGPIAQAVSNAGSLGCTARQLGEWLDIARPVVQVTLRRLRRRGVVWPAAARGGHNDPQRWFGTEADAKAWDAMAPGVRDEREQRRVLLLDHHDDIQRQRRAERADQRMRQAEARAAALAQREREVAARQLERAKRRIRVANVPAVPAAPGVAAPVHIAPRHQARDQEVIVPPHVVVQVIPRAPGRYEVDTSQPFEGGGFMTEWRTKVLGRVPA